MLRTQIQKLYHGRPIAQAQAQTYFLILLIPSGIAVIRWKLQPVQATFAVKLLAWGQTSWGLRRRYLDLCGENVERAELGFYGKCELVSCLA